MIGAERIPDDTPLFKLTVGELKTFIESIIPQVPVTKEKKYVYGYKGIAEIFQCSLSKAQSIKMSGAIDKAIIQTGRIIKVDVDLALKLLQK